MEQRIPHPEASQGIRRGTRRWAAFLKARSVVSLVIVVGIVRSSGVELADTLDRSDERALCGS
jgi:hypothetical protein